jgi:enoyl-CoA hydratase/carnithine racemase
MKPIIAAVNGLAYGGGMEMLTNLDIVVAAKSATFALPEVKRGVVAMAGALPRIVRTIGRQRAMEMALTGRIVSRLRSFLVGSSQRHYRRCAGRRAHSVEACREEGT